MNKRILTLIICLVSLAISCDNTDDPSQDTLQNRFTKTWKLTSDGYVKASGVNVTDKYTDLSFTFNSDGTYSSSVNTKSTTGIWKATDSSISTVILDDSTTVHIIELTNERLLVSFTNQGMINARSKGISTFEILLFAE